MWHQSVNCNFMKPREYFLRKENKNNENKNNNFIPHFHLYCFSCGRAFTTVHDTSAWWRKRWSRSSMMTLNTRHVSSIIRLHCCSPWTDWKANRCHFWTSLRTFSPISVSSEQLHWEALTQINLSWSSVFAIMHNLQSLPQPSLLLNGDRTVWENCPCSSHFVWLCSHSTSCLCYSKLLCVWLDWRRRSLYLPSAPHIQLHYNSFAVDSRTQSICC